MSGLFPAVAWGASAGASEPAKPREKPLSTISSITLERGGFGLATGSVVTLRREGPSRLTQTGNARHGTEDVTREGTLLPSEFEALVRLLDAKAFFGMADTYDNPQLQDGPWMAISVVHDGGEKRVFSRADAAPERLQAIEAAIAAAGARVRFDR